MDNRSQPEVVFIAALEKTEPGERAAYLDEACAGNETLRVRVEALLTAHAHAGLFLERPVAEVENAAALGTLETDAGSLATI